MSSPRDWQREIDRAAEWLAGQFVLAIDRAYPPGSLWGATGPALKAEGCMREFRGALRSDISERWSRSGIPWNRDEPLHGELLRRVGVEGRFANTSIVHAARTIGADEVLDELPDGLAVVINPGYLWAKTSMRDKGTRIEVERGDDGH